VLYQNQRYVLNHPTTSCVLISSRQRRSLFGLTHQHNIRWPRFHTHRAEAPNPRGTGARAPPHYYKWLGTGGGTVSRRTANKKLTKLYWPSRKRLPKRLIVGYF